MNRSWIMGTAQGAAGDQGDWISPMMLPSASFTDAISLPPPTSLIACCASAPASASTSSPTPRASASSTWRLTL
jgi:hypothetical protein